MRKVKIVCTLGPATTGVKTLISLMRAGMDVARLNFSHGEHATHAKMYRDLRAAAKKVGRPVAILGDLCGPKIRVGRIRGGRVELADGSRVRLTARVCEGNAKVLPHSYPSMARDVQPGEPILINDGLIRLRVVSVERGDVLCDVETGGVVSDHKGINLPQTRTSVPALTDKDRKDLAFAARLGVDYLALSFVRSADDVREAKELAGSIPVIAKIEKPEAVADLDAILDAADGVMVARGDLGVEVGHEKVPLIQKRIIASMRPRAKPVITATQMLESMISNYTPTRAEVSDVANAVLDGTDAVMLSGETSVGKYPVHVVETMGSIIDEIEGAGADRFAAGLNPIVRERNFSSAIAEAVTAAAREYGLSAIAVYSESGRSAAFVSAERPKAAIIAFSRHDAVLNRLALCWGVRPLHGDWVKGIEGVIAQAEQRLLAHGLVKPGQDIAVTFGVRLGDEPFQTNVLKLWKVRKDAFPPLKPRRRAPR